MLIKNKHAAAENINHEVKGNGNKLFVTPTDKISAIIDADAEQMKAYEAATRQTKPITAIIEV